jgi:pimeloyl-ACP methyl ester carboxylesterase
MLERRFEVLAPTLAGHAGGPEFPPGGAGDDAIVDALEAALDAAAWEAPAIAGNSLGGFIALKLAERGRARSVVALTPAGGRVPGDPAIDDLLAHLIRGAAACDSEPLVVFAEREGWRFDPERITCPVRLVWGTDDKILVLPDAAAHYRAQLPQAEWIEIEGGGHCPQLDHPAEAAELIAGFSA